MVLSMNSSESCRVHRPSCVLCTWSAVAASFPLSPSSWTLTASTDILKLCNEIQGKEWNMVGAFWWFFFPPISTFLNQEVHFWRLENQITDPVCTVEVLSWIWAALVHFIHGFFFFPSKYVLGDPARKVNMQMSGYGESRHHWPPPSSRVNFMYVRNWVWVPPLVSISLWDFFPLVHFVLYSFMWTFFLN